MDALLAAVDAVAPCAYRRTNVKDRYGIVTLHEDGPSIRMIADKLHISRRTVVRWIDEYRWKKDI